MKARAILLLCLLPLAWSRAATAAPGTSPAGTSTVDAPSVADRIATGRRLMDDLEFEAAATELVQAATDRRATDEERMEANLYAGIAHRVIGRDADARLNFEYVLRRAPETELPAGLPPNITSFYALIRESLDEDAKGSGSTMLVTLGAAVASLGVIAAAVGAGAAIGAEVALADGGVPGRNKQLLLVTGWVGLGIVAVAAVPVVSGVGLLAWGMLE